MAKVAGIDEHLLEKLLPDLAESVKSWLSKAEDVLKLNHQIVTKHVGDWKSLVNKYRPGQAKCFQSVQDMLRLQNQLLVERRLATRCCSLLDS